VSIKDRIKDFRRVKASDLVQNPLNWRTHDAYQRGIMESMLQEIGFAGAELVYEEDGQLVLIDGHMRQEILGDFEVPVLVTDLTASEAKTLLLAYDPISTLATMDIDRYASLAKMSEIEIETLNKYIQETATQAEDAEAAKKERGGLSRNLRNLPLDFIFTFDNLTDISVFLAHDAGLKIGTRSQKVILKNAERWNWRFQLTFIDNEYSNYDHELHLECATVYAPKYVTVRDIMSESQCREAKIKYYTLKEILAFAEDLQKVAENVIIIPKYDCVDEIPPSYVIGYSVPSSYGSTPIPITRFAGRRIHLLGGSLKDQIGYVNQMPDEVVSLDTNWVNKIANYGQFVLSNGQSLQLSDRLPEKVSNPRALCNALSFGLIGGALENGFEGFGK